jgi:SAM-dependent methyltransferase
MKSKTGTKAELESFQGIWLGGFCQGDPRDPVFGLWGITSFLGVSHSIYLACIKPYVTPETTVLEIGCGRGAWTKLILKARHVYALDALSAEHNSFYDYVGRHANVDYVKVEDFSLNEIPLNSVDFVFSYDALCHVSFGGITEYATNLFPRMRKGGHGFWMVADYEKYNNFVANQDRYSSLSVLLPRQKHPVIRQCMECLFHTVNRWNSRRYGLRPRDIHEDTLPRPGRWYHAGTQRTVEMLKAAGFAVLDADMGFDFRSPIIHFQK